jgi:hypothetical protein
MAASHNVGKIPTPGIPTPAVRQSKAAQPAAKPKQLTGDAAIAKNIYDMSPAGMAAEHRREAAGVASEAAAIKKAGYAGGGIR